MQVINYKLSKESKRKVILEFLANSSIEHTISDEDQNDDDYEFKYPDDIDSASECLAQGINISETIEWINLFIYNLLQTDKTKINKNINPLDFLLNSDLLNFLLPYANIETDYRTLNSTLLILYRLSDCDQHEDSPFQNLEFAENMIELIEKSEEIPTTRKMSLKLLNNLIIDDTIGNTIFQNLIHFKIPAVILSSNIIEKNTFYRLMDRTKGQYFKIVAKTAELLGNLAVYCKEDYLSIFASFFDSILFYISNDFSLADKKELILRNFLYLLSYMMKLDSNRKYAYSYKILDIIIDNILYQKAGIYIQYSYDIIYQIAQNDGLHPLFQTDKFYNLTRNAIQMAESIDVLSSIIIAIGAIMTYDYKNFLENEIISEFYDIFDMGFFKYKIKAAIFILRFYEVSSSDPEFCIFVLQNYQYLQKVCISIESFLADDIHYFLNVVRALTDKKSLELCGEIRNCVELHNVLDKLRSDENEEISDSANELLLLWDDQSQN